jgi:aspartyl protease family protein
MTENQGKIVPYGIAGLVLFLVTGLVAIDVVASLPDARGEAVPAATPPPAPETPAREIVIGTRREGTRHIVEARLVGTGGKTLRLDLVIDTGATSIVLPSSMMAPLGFASADLPKGSAQTAGGTVPTRAARLARVSIGQAEAADVEVLFIDDAIYGRDHTPLLGMSFLGRFRFAVDAAQDRLILTPGPEGAQG